MEAILVAIIVALIAVGGVIYTASVALRTSKNQRILSSVTADRIAWLTNLRQYVAAFYGAVHAGITGKLDSLALHDVERFGALVRLQLDPLFKADFEIETNILEVIAKFRKGAFSEMESTLDELLKCVQIHTNIELEKVYIEVLEGKIVILDDKARRRIRSVVPAVTRKPDVTKEIT